MTRPKRIDPDGKWVDFRIEPEYWAVLKETARAWLGLIRIREEQIPSGISSLERYARISVFNRTTNALPQLPIEWRGSESRYNRARWRLGFVETDSPMHCEHPWSKKITKKLIELLVANKTAGDDADLIDGICLILDARQDTLLLPSATLSNWSILTERNHDGLAQRYATAVTVYTLIDRKDGSVLSLQNLYDLDAAASNKIKEAFATSAPEFSYLRDARET